MSTEPSHPGQTYQILAGAAAHATKDGSRVEELREAPATHRRFTSVLSVLLIGGIQGRQP